ncbi:MAG: MFS transporter [Treponema sp.]|jgi:fucose permease|nr:MFS transporter [Treponema sp.]
MSFLLIIIYLSFISLGLPDSLLGAVWPVMQPEFGVSVPFGGYLGMTVSVCTVISALSAMWLHKHLGTGKTIAISTTLTALSLLGYSLAPSFWMLFPLAVVLGLGGGAIDSALNNYVAVHYRARHMSFLHACWGVGATVGPLILSVFLAHGSWRNGYRLIAVIQGILAALQFISMPLWKKQDSIEQNPGETMKGTVNPRTKILAMLSFLFYCAYETSCILWIATYFVRKLGTDKVSGARASSAFFFGITAGRFLSGFISDKVGVKRMIYLGSAIAFLGSAGLLVTTSLPAAYALTLLIGLGCAPIYPSMIHRTPRRYGSELSPKIIGLQMATAYIGSTAVPPLAGLLAVHSSFSIIPIIGLFCMLMVFGFTWIIEHSSAAAKI